MLESRHHLTTHLTAQCHPTGPGCQMTSPSRPVLTTMGVIEKIMLTWRPVGLGKLSHWTVPSDPPPQYLRQPLGSTLWAATSRISITIAHSRSLAQPIRTEHVPTWQRRPMTIKSLRPLHRLHLSCHQQDRWRFQTAPSTLLLWQHHCTLQLCLVTKVALPPSPTLIAPPHHHHPQLATSPPPPVLAAKLPPLLLRPRCPRRQMAGSQPLD